MRTIRIFVEGPLQDNSIAQLGAAAGAHVSRVLRLEPGDEVVLFDGRGSEYPGAIVEMRGSAVRVQITTGHAPLRESPLQITLAQGISRSERMDLVIQKATELGVTAIQPVLTERSVVKLDAEQAEKKFRHWRGIAISACEQSGRNRLPEILRPMKLTEWLVTTAGTTNKLLLDPAAGASLRQLTEITQATLLIGPEGGLSDEECAQATNQGFTGITLGPRILRTETAALAAIAALQTRFGDL